jgi:hypothetical protein
VEVFGMPGYCTFMRSGGEWVMQSDCDYPRGPCVGIPNSQLLGQTHTADSGSTDEMTFLGNFKTLFGNNFSFQNGDILELACKTLEGAFSTDKNSTYKRQGAAGFPKMFFLSAGSGAVPSVAAPIQES